MRQQKQTCGNKIKKIVGVADYKYQGENMVKITICIGSSCHLKGSRQVVEGLQELIKKGNYGDQIEIAGAFCMGKCASAGVSVTVNDEFFSVDPEKVEEFFDNNVLTQITA